MKLLWRTDVHLSDHTPRSRTDNWRESILAKLRQVGEIAKDIGAAAVIDGGDFFDIKSPGRNSHNLVREVADLHSDYPCPVYANVGNHDCVYGDIEYLPQQPLGVLFATGVFKRLHDEHEIVFKRDFNGKHDVRVVGVPYHGTKYDMDRFKIVKGDEAYLVAACHVLASPRGGTMFENEDIVKYEDLLKLAPDVDVWLFGHWHKDQGITEIAPGKWVVNVGSLSRGALIQDDLDRKPCAVELGFSADGIEIVRHDLELPEVEDIFDLDGRQKAEMRETVMESFVASLSKTLNLDQEGQSLDDVVRASEVPDIVRERALSYLEQA
jgi:exonuclease SbcD